MPIESAGLTDVGRKREHNEDALLVLPQFGLYCVADGMGGHNAGEVASNIAVTTMEKFFSRVFADADGTWPFRFDRRFDEFGNRLVVGIQHANQVIRDAAVEESKKGMGTTCVAVHILENRAYFGWVGDSRGYLYRKGTLHPVTSDHSLVNELMRTGRITAKEAENFQHKNVITRALGIADAVQVDVETRELEDGDIALVCCDGLTGMLEDERIAQILEAETSLEKACSRLIDAANAAGGTDNITVALARYRS